MTKALALAIYFLMAASIATGTARADAPDSRPSQLDAESGGSHTGNGGSVWVCRNPDRSIRWIELVDLFEARREFLLTVEKSNSVPMTEQIDRAMARARQGDAEFARQLEDHLKLVRQIVKHTSAPLTEIPDIKNRVKAEMDCPRGAVRAEQLANFTNYSAVASENAVLITDTLWSLLEGEPRARNGKHRSVTDQAALYVHEAVYSLLRAVEGAARDSSRARMITAHLFSTAAPEGFAHILKLRPVAAPTGKPGAGDASRIEEVLDRSDLIALSSFERARIEEGFDYRGVADARARAYCVLKGYRDLAAQLTQSASGADRSGAFAWVDQGRLVSTPLPDFANQVYYAVDRRAFTSDVYTQVTRARCQELRGRGEACVSSRQYLNRQGGSPVGPVPIVPHWVFTSIKCRKSG